MFFLHNSCSEEFRKSHKNILVMEFFSSKFAYWNFTIKGPQHRFSTVNFEQFYITAFRLVFVLLLFEAFLFEILPVFVKQFQHFFD